MAVVITTKALSNESYLILTSNFGHEATIAERIKLNIVV
jgi:hypothetical protein